MAATMFPKVDDLKCLIDNLVIAYQALAKCKREGAAPSLQRMLGTGDWELGIGSLLILLTLS